MMALIEEHWVIVDGWPNYEVSNYGRVVSIRTEKERVQIPINGFLFLVLFKDGKGTGWYVHRLVAQAFFLNYDDDHEVKHINGDKHDNTVLNLTLGPKKARPRGIKNRPNEETEVDKWLR